ncbi:hypothetical protein J2768_000916 [Agrobacterium tumefaciens]|nr:hypothetical protein [Agrobacterium tumefaciens]
MPPYARRTGRLEHLVHHLALALGGRPAARFAQRLMLPVSNDTLLRVIRRQGFLSKSFKELEEIFRKAARDEDHEFLRLLNHKLTFRQKIQKTPALRAFQGLIHTPHGSRSEPCEDPRIPKIGRSTRATSSLILDSANDAWKGNGAGKCTCAVSFPSQPWSSNGIRRCLS